MGRFTSHTLAMTSPTPTFPDFYDQAPRLLVRDPLAEFLGAAAGGVIEYGYADVVRLAGHSCPTVAGAYLMVRRGLRALYGDALPERGGIDVVMQGAANAGTTGVIASVAQLLTGAAAETGFQGIGPSARFARNDLLRFGGAVDAILALRRRDSGAGVQLQLDASIVAWSEDMPALLPRAIAGRASADELARFGQLWQERVRRMLVEHADDPRLVRLNDWPQ